MLVAAESGLLACKPSYLYLYSKHGAVGSLFQRSLLRQKIHEMCQHKK